jgi:hypothetical protein
VREFCGVLDVGLALIGAVSTWKLLKLTGRARAHTLLIIFLIPQ